MNATVLSPVAMTTVPSVGTTTELNNGLLSSVTVQVVPVGIPARRYGLPGEAGTPVRSKALSLQSMSNRNVPGASAAFVITSVPRSRVLVNATVLSPVPITTVPSAGTETELNSGLFSSVTVQVVPVGMPARV